jgi:hypothetical protein
MNDGGMEPVLSPTCEVHADHVAPARCKGDLPLQNEFPLETRRARANDFQNVATQFGGGGAGFAAAATEHGTKMPKAIWILRSSKIALLVGDLSLLLKEGTQVFNMIIYINTYISQVSSLSNSPDVVIMFLRRVSRRVKWQFLCRFDDLSPKIQ